MKTKRKSSKFKWRSQPFLIFKWWVFFLIFFCPLLLGGVDDWVILVFEVTVALMWVYYLLSSEKPEPSPAIKKLTTYLTRLIVAMGIFLIFQILPLPTILVKLISPHSYSLREMFSIGASTSSWMTISVAPFKTIKESLELLSYALFVLLIFKTVVSFRVIKKFFWALVGLGSFQALYGIIELLNPHPRLLFFPKEINLQVATGTYVNQNHFSGLLEMTLPITLGLFLVQMEKLFAPALSWKDKILQFSEKKMTGGLILGLLALLQVLGVWFSRSRSGIIVVFLEFIFFLIILTIFFQGDKFKKRQSIRILQVVLIIVLVVIVYTGASSTISRFTLEKLNQEGRFHYWATLGQMITDFPFFGSGLGTFASLYPAYESGKTYGLLLHAHNDYLEFFLEMGLVGMIFLFGGISLVVIKTGLQWVKRRNFQIKIMSLAAMIGVFGLAIHSLTDFNLHIPANAIIFSLILSLSLILVYWRPQKD